jgi:hypothetical protein
VAFVSRVISGDPISPALLLARARRVVLGTPQVLPLL